MASGQPIPILDGHNDTILNLHMARRGETRSFFRRSERGHIDLPRAREGGLAGGFFALFTPSPNRSVAGTPAATGAPTAPPQGPIAQVERAQALEFTIAMAARMFRLEAQAPKKIKVVRTVDELAHCLDNGIFAMIFHIEGAEVIDAKLDTLELLYQAGLRSLGITWSRPNIFATGVPFKFPQSPDIGPGLTKRGFELVRACNRLGVMLDLSHLNEAGFWDVAKTSDAPLVATHSCAYALSQSARNLTDKQLDAVRDSGGIVGVNFHVGFLRADGRVDPNTSLTEIVRHLDYMVGRMGIDHVAFGSDFDGATMPGDLRDAAGLPRLMDALRRSGYDDAALRKIAYENWLRVLGRTWKN
jgi:membrane dipeptidase